MRDHGADDLRRAADAESPRLSNPAVGFGAGAGRALFLTKKRKLEQSLTAVRRTGP